jgi:hypothetical protein
VLSHVFQKAFDTSNVQSDRFYNVVIRNPDAAKSKMYTKVSRSVDNLPINLQSTLYSLKILFVIVPTLLNALLKYIFLMLDCVIEKSLNQIKIKFHIYTLYEFFSDGKMSEQLKQHRKRLKQFVSTKSNKLQSFSVGDD